MSSISPNDFDDVFIPGIDRSDQPPKTSKFFNNFATRLFMNPDNIHSDKFANKLKAGVITVLTGVVILGALVGLAYLGIALAPIALATMGLTLVVPTWVAATGGVVSGVTGLTVLAALLKGLSKVGAAISSRTSSKADGAYLDGNGFTGNFNQPDLDLNRNAIGRDTSFGSDL